MRIFLAHIVPKNQINSFRVAQAAHNFSYTLIEAGVFDKVYSIMPSNVGGEKTIFQSEVYELVYSRLRGNKHLLKIAALHENIKLFFKIGKEDYLWLYNVTVINILLIRLLRLFKPKVRIFPIILDFSPELTQCQAMLPTINKSNGMITLSTSPLFKVKNYFCFPGVVPKGYPEHSKVEGDVKKEFLLSGNLSEQISMLSILLPAFSKMPHYILHITGRLQNQHLVEEYTKQYKNIVYHGLLSFDDYLKLLERVPFLLSTRDPRAPENRCNFPSKIIEGLLYNRIIVSTIEYPQLKDIKYFTVSPCEEGFIHDIQRICANSNDAILEYANQSEKVYKYFNTDRWELIMTQIEGCSK